MKQAGQCHEPCRPRAAPGKGGGAGAASPEWVSTTTTRWERVVVLNRYGTLLFLVAALLAAIGAVLLVRASSGGLGGTAWAGGAALFAAVAVAWYGGQVSRRLGHRRRLFRNVLTAFRRSGFDERCFENLCGELCTRRVVWLVLNRVGRRGRYRAVVRRYRRRGTFYVVHQEQTLDGLIRDGLIDEAEVRAAVGEALQRQALEHG